MPTRFAQVVAKGKAMIHRHEPQTSVARIEVDGKRAGSGVLVRDRLHKNDLVLTALHVVATENGDPKGTIILRFPARPEFPPYAAFPGHETTATLIGRYDAEHDWALLRCTKPHPGEPCSLHDLTTSGGSYKAFGYPDAEPLDGMDARMEIRNHSGMFCGTRAIQIYSDEASAGEGMPVHGFSGAPCFADKAVFAILRSTLERGGDVQGRNRGGTLYACPAWFVAKSCGDLLDLPDPHAGLPPIQKALDYPALPYRDLEYYTEADALIFRGRVADIRRIMDRLCAPHAAPLLVLHGESGVGKSSLLRAGVLPRWDGHYFDASRDPKSGLEGTLEALLGADAANGWREREKDGRPLLLVIDQVEEAFTKPLTLSDEVGDFLAVIGPLLAGNNRPKGRLVLSIRKEWFTNIQTRLNAWTGLRWDQVEVGRLDRDAVIDIVEGLTPARLPDDPYQLRLDPPDLAVHIAWDLLRDPDSPVAPILQVLMTSLWGQAEEKLAAVGTRTITDEMYGAARIANLGEFLNRQMKTLEQDTQLERMVRSGLALDILYSHTTEHNTAASRTAEEFQADYIIPRLRGETRKTPNTLLHRLQTLHLLESRSGHGTRLAHDTLALPVRKAFGDSQASGQRARRVLEYRVKEWMANGTLLDASDVRTVMAGRKGMRGLTSPETELVQKSWYRVLLWAIIVGLLALAAAVAGAGFVVVRWNHWLDTRERLALSQIDRAQAALRRHDIASAVVAFGSVIGILPSSDPRRESALAGVVCNMPYAPHVVHEFGPITNAVLSVDADRAVMVRSMGRTEVFEASTGKGLAVPPELRSFENSINRQETEIAQLGLSDDGRCAFVVYHDMLESHKDTLVVWRLEEWRPENNTLVYMQSYRQTRSSLRVKVTAGPRGYLFIGNVNGDSGGEILRTRKKPCQRFFLPTGEFPVQFPPTGEPYLVWLSGHTLSLLDLDRIPDGISGSESARAAVLWSHTLASEPDFVKWQGLPGQPAFVTRYYRDREMTDGLTVVCTSTSCTHIDSSYPLVVFPDAPTTGTRTLTKDLMSLLELEEPKLSMALVGKALWAKGASWAHGPSPNSVSSLSCDSRDLSVVDLDSRARQPTRRLTPAIAWSWNQTGSRLWAIDRGGRLVSAPIRSFESSVPIKSPVPNDNLDAEGEFLSALHSAAGDKVVCGEPCAGGCMLRYLDARRNTRSSWVSSAPVEAISTDGEYVIIDYNGSCGPRDAPRPRGVAERMGVREARSGAKIPRNADFMTSGGPIEGDVWVGSRRKLAAIRVEEKGEGYVEEFAVCEWVGETSTPVRRSVRFHEAPRISPDGMFFIVGLASSKTIYSSARIGQNENPVLSCTVKSGCSMVDLALLELLLVSSEHVSISTTAKGTHLTAWRRGARFSVCCSKEGRVSIFTAGRELNYKATSDEDVLFSKCHVALSWDGSWLVVERTGEGSTAPGFGEVWDTRTGVLVAVLPLPTPTSGSGLTFSADNERLRLLARDNMVDLLYFGPSHCRPPGWASEAGMSALTGSREGDGRSWQTRSEVLQAITEGAHNSDRISAHLAHCMADSERGHK